MSERLHKCPLCKSGNILNHQLVKDHAVSKKEFTLCRCGDCTLLFTNPRPTEEEINPYYDFEEYYSHEDQVRSFTQWLYQKVRKSSIQRKVRLINSLVKGGSLLDYGCGTGEFLQEAKKQHWNVLGIEPSDKARTQAFTKLPTEVLGTLDELPELEAYNVITLFHVLEHIHSLRKTVKKLITRLKSDGYMIIAVPNPESADARHYGNNWAGYDVPRHLYHFSQKSMKTFQEQFGLELTRIEALTYDSYYVSLLSERYKNPKEGILTHYMNALIQGYRSNQSAEKPGNHSSNIFIFKKK
jgi:2-polyprenyl-3-methyl-5-hydroxy-6-metoxy-1,4-benzoquinol methylase